MKHLDEHHTNTRFNQEKKDNEVRCECCEANEQETLQIKEITNDYID